MLFKKCYFIQIEKIKKFSIPICITTNKFNIIGRHIEDKKKFVIPRIKNPVYLPDGFLLYFTQDNVAHSICQFIRSFYEYCLLDKKPFIYVSEIILRMPFLHKLFILLFNTNEYKILNLKQYYYFENLYIPDYIWFTDGQNFKINYDIENSVRILDTNIGITKEYNNLYEALLLFDKTIDIIFEENKDKYPIYENIILIKSNLCTDSMTPYRQIFLEPNFNEILYKYNYEMILPHKINDIINHIVLLKSAKNIITSYGGANCVNRFFFNKNSVVKVICNEAYSSEYMDINHNLISSYCTLKYLYFLNINNSIKNNTIEYIINYKNY